MSRLRMILVLLILACIGASTGWTASWHLFAGGSLGVFSLQPEQEIESDRSFTAQATVALEFSLITSPVDARIGLQGNFNRPLQDNDFMDNRQDLDWGIYAKGKIAFVYAGLGWQRLALDARTRKDGPLMRVSGWIPFQVVGVEFRVALVSLNIEVQRYRGDLTAGSSHLAYRRTLARVLVGLHF